MAVRETMQARQAALLLHGLPPAARRQVIARLDAAETARLIPLMEELSALGVSQLLGQLLHAQEIPCAPTLAEPLTVQEKVARLDAEIVVRCLESCSPATVARLMRADAWPWKVQVLDRMPDAHRADVLKHMRGKFTPLAPAVLKALCERLCQSAARAPVNGPEAGESPASRPADIKTRFRRLTGWMR